jgi:hypothetical protein
MLRIRWTDTTDDSTVLIGWQQPSMVLATLFLNFIFWFMPAQKFWFSGPSTTYFVSLGMVAAFVLALFFLAPALAAHNRRQSLFQVAEASFGVVPALGFRTACAALCILWIAGMATTVSLFLINLLHRHRSAIEVVLFSTVCILFLFATGLQSLRTSARLAFFTNKLGIVLLIAAAIRVSRYIPSAWGDLGGAVIETDQVWTRIAEPLMMIGPMALLAADFGARTRTRKDVVLIGIFGFAVPMVTTLFVVSLIQRAAYHWHSGLGNSVNIGTALWGGDSERYAPQWFMLTLMTVFGFARLSVYMWRAAVAPLTRGRRSWLVVLAAAILIAEVLSVIPNDNGIFMRSLEVSARLGACVAAVLSADSLLSRWVIRRTRTVAWSSLMFVIVGCLAGGSMSFWYGPDYELHLTASILIPYGVSFVLCLAGRAIECRTAVTSPDAPGAET